LGISGGEPLLRDDIEEIVVEAKKLGYYSNLITSGVGLTEKESNDSKKADWIIFSYQCMTLLKKLITSLQIPKLLN
jgi:wyosine [tRNA(Phe)-imidazoG37] synthetase (radical SAM superfamily)